MAKKREEKWTVLIAGYPARVRAVADLLDQVGTGVMPLQVGVLDGSREFLAKLSLCAPDAIVIFGGPFKEELVPLLKRIRATTEAPILVILMQARLRYEELKKAGATEVFQKVSDISADEVVEQLLGMLRRHDPPVRSRSRVGLIPRFREDGQKLVSKPRAADSKPKPKLEKLQRPTPAQKLSIKKPEPVVMHPIPPKTFIVPGRKRETPNAAVTSRIALVPPSHDRSSEGLEVANEIVNGRRKVTLEGRSLFLSTQLCSLLKLLYNRGEEGAGLEKLYGVGLFTFETAGIAVGNLRKQLVKVNRRWGEVLYCRNGTYYFNVKKKK